MRQLLLLVACAVFFGCAHVGPPKQTVVRSSSVVVEGVALKPCPIDVPVMGADLLLVDSTGAHVARAISASNGHFILWPEEGRTFTPPLFLALGKAREVLPDSEEIGHTYAPGPKRYEAEVHLACEAKQAGGLDLPQWPRIAIREAPSHAWPFTRAAGEGAAHPISTNGPVGP